MLLARLLLLAALVLVLVLGDVPESTRFWNALFDAGHAPLFGVIALVIRSLLVRSRGDGLARRASLAAFAVTFVVAVASEAIQRVQPHRDVSVADFLRDIAGAGAFLLLAEAWRSRHAPGRLFQSRGSRAVAALAAAALLAAAAGEVALTSARYVARNRSLPALYALDGSWWERDFIATGRNALTPGRAPADPGAGAAATLARLDLEPGLYSGITFDEPYPDWRGYDRLAFTIVSSLEQPIELVIRVHDASHDQRLADRFNRTLVIAPGANRIAIPINDIRRAPDRREMDLQRVRGIILFVYRLNRPVRLSLGPITLE